MERIPLRMLEHYVINQLRNDPAFVPELDFVMYLKESDEEGKLIRGMDDFRLRITF